MSRLEVWIGGLKEPDIDWTRSIEVLISEELGGIQITGYKAFHPSLSAHGAIKAESKIDREQGTGMGGVPLSRASSGYGSGRIGK